MSPCTEDLIVSANISFKERFTDALKAALEYLILNWFAITHSIALTLLMNEQPSEAHYRTSM